jgi:hypothetical protein
MTIGNTLPRKDNISSSAIQKDDDERLRIGVNDMKLIPQQPKVMLDDICYFLLGGYSSWSFLYDYDNMVTQHCSSLLNLIRGPSNLLNHPWPLTRIPREVNDTVGTPVQIGMLMWSRTVVIAGAPKGEPTIHGCEW